MRFDDWSALKPNERVKKVLSQLILDHSFYGAIGLNLEHIVDPTCKTLWVDGICVGYNPVYVEKLLLPELTGTQAHEYQHVANKHHIRRGNRDRELWNEACDYSINPLLKRGGFQLPDGHLDDPRFYDMSAEQIYAILVQERNQQKEPDKSDDQDPNQDPTQEEPKEGDESQEGSQEDQDSPQDGTDDQTEGDGTPDDSDDENGDPDSSPGDSNEEGEDESEDSGSGGGEDDRSEEEGEGSGSGSGDGEEEGEGSGSGGDEGGDSGEGEGDEQSGGSGGGDAGSQASGAGEGEDEDGNGGIDVGGCGEVRDCPDLSETGKKEQEQKWDIILTQAVNLSQRMGDMPAYLKRVMDEVLDSKVPWEEVLLRWLVEQATVDYSWKHPNRRYLDQGFILPSLKGDELLPIAFIVDTSGSQDRQAINQCGSEIQAALACYDFEFSVPVVYCDSAVQGLDKIDPFDEVKLEPVGGGGTDFRPPFKYFEDEGMELEGAIYLTDGYCYRFPEKEPYYPVLWVITPRGDRHFNPPFGEVVCMND